LSFEIRSLKFYHIHWQNQSGAETASLIFSLQSRKMGGKGDARMSRFRMLAIFMLVLTGCGAPPTPTPTVLPTPIPTATPEPLPTFPPQPTRLIIPTALALPTVVVTPSILAPTRPATTIAPTIAASATTPTRTPTLARGTMNIKLFFVALEDNGKAGKKIGCNDSIIAVDRAIPETQGVLVAAFNELFSIREAQYGQSGLYNSLSQSKLKLESAAVINGVAMIKLTGGFQLGGVCDNPRAKAQLEELALQFSTVKQVNITVNDISLDKVLSEKGN
jgi:hypothetical protein